MSVVDASGDPPPDPAIELAAQALAAGQVVAIPTDTVYGLAADAFHTGGADRIFQLKVRPRDVDLPLLVADLEQARGLVEDFTPSAEALVERFWPGALTVILPRAAGMEADLGSDEFTVGLRCPDHPVPKTLCRQAGPLATTSANRHGEAELTSAREVSEAFGDALAVVLDAGPCRGGPSTVVDCTGSEPKCLREGRIPWDELLAAL